MSLDTKQAQPSTPKPLQLPYALSHSDPAPRGDMGLVSVLHCPHLGGKQRALHHFQRSPGSSQVRKQGDLEERAPLTPSLC